MKTKEEREAKKREKEQARAAKLNMPKSVTFREADYTVLMIGQRRAGKSSVLSSMITAMERMRDQTGFRFRADDATKILMRTKQSQLQMIFTTFRDQEEFCTLEGEAGGQQFSAPTDEYITYRFFLGLASRPEGDREQVVDFVDVPGEEILNDMSEGFKRQLARSSVVIVAVDAPSLMEGKETDGVGQLHTAVNMPVAIHNHFVQADTALRADIEGEKGAKFPPKLVLFVPLKCEKYYYSDQMGELSRRLRLGYQDLLTFFGSKDEYTVAIVPILTLGDVVFDHYRTKDRGDGKQVVIKYGAGDGPASMKAMPRYPMFRFRGADPKFSPRYCEQPLMYLLVYILAGVAAAENKKGPGRWLLNGAMLNFGLLGALLWLAAKGIAALAKDKELLGAVQKVAANLKTSGDGFEVIYDRLGLKDGKPG